MQPNSPTPTSDPYSFLYEDAKKPKKQLIPSGNSPKQRIILAAIVLVIVILLGVVVASILGRSGAANRQDLITVVNKQTELVRVANIGAAKATDSRTKGYALTTSLAIASNQEALLAAYKKNGIKLDKKELAGSKNSATDTKLSNAEKGNNFDAVFTEELNSQLASYKAAVKKAFDGSKGTSTRNALNVSYNQVTVIQGTVTNQ